MSLFISTERTSAMAAQRTEQNPIIAFDNFATAANTVTDLAALNDGDLANAFDGGTFSFWAPATTGATSATLTVNLGEAKTCNFLGVAAHSFATAPTDLAISYSADGVTYSEITKSGTQSDAANVGLYFMDTAAQYWRIVFTFASGAAISVGAISLCRALTMPTRVYQSFTPPLQSTSVELLSNVTEGGNFVATTVTRRGQSAGFDFNLLKPEFVRGDQFQKFQRLFNSGNPVFVAWRPVKYAQDLLYGWRQGGAIVPANTGPIDFMACSMSLRAFNDKP